jgi:hypothetical protein
MEFSFRVFIVRVNGMASRRRWGQSHIMLGHLLKEETTSFGRCILLLLLHMQCKRKIFCQDTQDRGSATVHSRNPNVVLLYTIHTYINNKEEEEEEEKSAVSFAGDTRNAEKRVLLECQHE